MSFSIEIHADQKISEVVKNFRVELPEAIADGMKAGRLRILRRVRENLRTSRIPSLRNSWQEGDVEIFGDSASVALFSRDHMARLREEGSSFLPGGKILPGKGTVKSGPRKGQKTLALSVPLPAARTAGGVSRGIPAEHGELTMIVRKGKPPLLVKKFGGGERLPRIPGNRTGQAQRTRGGGFIPLFVLMKSVTLPPYPYVAPAIESSREEVAALVAKRVRKILGT